MFPFQNANEIVPGLWIGNLHAAADETFLTKNRILSVFNCTKNLPFHPSVAQKFRVPVDDNLQEVEIRNMELWAPEIAYKIMHAKRDGPVLVHCHAGMQRSAAAVAIALIAMHGMKADDAMRLIRERRPIAFTPAANFERAVRSFEKTYFTEIQPQVESAAKA